jgi:hypothetical protein
MKCPTCLTTMECISAINPVPGQPGRDRMDLHCVKKDGRRRGCNGACFMGVITEDPKEWVCHEYRFSFDFEDQRYLLRSYNYAVDFKHQSFRRNPNETRTILQTISGDDLIVLPYFMPISTGDDMHERAWELFHRLRNLVIYS